MLTLAIFPILLTTTILLAWFAIWSHTRLVVGPEDLTPPIAIPVKELRLLDHLSVVPWEWDLDEGRYTFMGHQVEELFGYPSEDWYDSDLWLETLHPEDVESVKRSFMYAIWHRTGGAYIYRGIRRDGEVIRLETRVTVVLEGERPRYVCGTTHSMDREELPSAAGARCRCIKKSVCRIDGFPQSI